MASTMTLLTNRTMGASSTSDVETSQRGLKLDLVQGLQVRRVADRDEKPLAALQDRQDPMLEQQLLVDELDDVQVEVHGIEVEQRHAKLMGCGDRDLARVA
jgi:hypothetical protein